MKKVKPNAIHHPDEADLRRWCIEQAIRWPVMGPYSAGMQQFHQPAQDADVLGRAARILAWVTGRS